jgi:hypothetical protein
MHLRVHVCVCVCVTLKQKTQLEKGKACMQFKTVPTLHHGKGATWISYTLRASCPTDHTKAQTTSPVPGYLLMPAALLHAALVS